MEVVLYGRAGCHLCERAREVLRRLSDEVGFELRDQDVDVDSDLVDQYGDRVPVVVVEGDEVAAGRVNDRDLQRILKAIAVDRTSQRS